MDEQTELSQIGNFGTTSWDYAQAFSFESRQGTNLQSIGFVNRCPLFTDSSLHPLAHLSIEALKAPDVVPAPLRGLANVWRRLCQRLFA